MCCFFLGAAGLINAQEVSSIITDENGTPIHFSTIYNTASETSGTTGPFSFAAKTGSNQGKFRVYGGEWRDIYVTPAFAAEVSYLK